MDNNTPRFKKFAHTQSAKNSEIIPDNSVINNLLCAVTAYMFTDGVYSANAEDYMLMPVLILN